MSSIADSARHWVAKLPRPLVHAGEVVVHAAKLWIGQDGTELGASIAFYSLFALAPLLVVTIALAGQFFGPEAARGQIYSQMADLVGPAAAKGIEAMISSAWRSGQSGWAAMAATVTLLIGASGVFAEMRRALNRIGSVHAKESAIGAFVRARLVAFALVLGVGFLFVASLLASAALSAASDWLAVRVPVLAAVLSPLDFVVSTAVLTCAFWAFLRWLPDVSPGMFASWVGAVVSALLFAVGKQLIGLYLGRASVSSSYGAAGSLVVVMLWVYYSSQILLFGAAVAWAIEGEKAGEKDVPQRVSPPATSR